MQAQFDQIVELLTGYLPNIIAALAVLVVGWLIAVVVAALTRTALRKTSIDNRVSTWFEGKEAADLADVERRIGRGVFCLVMLFVVIAFLHVLGLTVITEPPTRFLVKVFDYAPRVLGAGILLVVAWTVARGIRFVITRGLVAAKLDERIGKQVGSEEEGRSLAQAIGDTGYWLVLLLFLPAILGTLALEGLLEPVRVMFTQMLGFLPNVFAAALILAVGWFMARVVQRIVANLLVSIDADRLSEEVGLAQLLGAYRLSNLVSSIVYVLILIPVLVAALNALALDAITEPASAMLDTVLAALPAIFGATLVLVIAFVIARVVARWVTEVLTGLGFNKILANLGLGKEPAEGERTPSQVVGYLVVVATMVFASIEALRLLEFIGLAELLVQFTFFAADVLVGLIIFALGLYFAGVVARIVEASGKPQSGLLATAARLFILVLAGAMALRQMGFANEVISLAFGLLIGAIAVAVALAFGLGGRDIAARALEDWLQLLKSRKD